MQSEVLVTAIPLYSLPATPWGVFTDVRRVLLRMRLCLQDLCVFSRRLIDIIVAGFALLAVSPLLLLAAIGIKLTSPGPVLFRQARVGKNGRRFIMFKLRTMITGADAMKLQLAADHGENIRFKMRFDPRVTPLGRTLRKYSIDELPQLWNVFVGDMTLVGPRPPVLSEVARYDVYTLRRLEISVGLTCFWQVGGRSEIPFTEQIKLDIAYIDRATLADNLMVLLKTLPAVLSGRGAY